MPPERWTRPSCGRSDRHASPGDKGMEDGLWTTRFWNRCAPCCRPSRSGPSRRTRHGASPLPRSASCPGPGCSECSSRPGSAVWRAILSTSTGWCGRSPRCAAPRAGWHPSWASIRGSSACSPSGRSRTCGARTRTPASPRRTPPWAGSPPSTGGTSWSADGASPRAANTPPGRCSAPSWSGPRGGRWTSSPCWCPVPTTVSKTCGTWSGSVAPPATTSSSRAPSCRPTGCSATTNRRS